MNKNIKNVMKKNTIRFLQNGYLKFNDFNILMQAIDRNQVNPKQDIKTNLDNIKKIYNY